MPVDTRDRQKHECYGAEWAVNWEQFGANDNLGELEDVWQYCYKLMRRQSFAKRYPATYRLHGKYKMKPERMNPYFEQVYVVGIIQSDQEGNPYRNMESGLIVRPTARGGFARDGKEIALSRWGRQKWVVIHELAHIIDHLENGRTGAIWHMDHGWQFCAIYLQLVGMAFGYEAKKALREEFKKRGVKYTKPQSMRSARHKRELSIQWVL